MEGFAERFLYELDCKGCTFKEIADFLGIGASTVKSWVYKGSIPAADTALKVARFLNVSLEYLITGEEREQTAPKAQTIRDFVTDEEYNYLSKYRALPDHDKIMMKKIIDAAYESLSSKNDGKMVMLNIS